MQALSPDRTMQLDALRAKYGSVWRATKQAWSYTNAECLAPDLKFHQVVQIKCAVDQPDPVRMARAKTCKYCSI